MIDLMGVSLKAASMVGEKRICVAMRGIMAEKKIMRADLAGAAEMTEARVMEIFACVGELRVFELISIAHALKVDPSELMR